MRIRVQHDKDDQEPAEYDVEWVEVVSYDAAKLVVKPDYCTLQIKEEEPTS